MKNLNKMKNDLYIITRFQKEKAWKEKDFDKSQEIRKEEKENYEKYKLIEGLIKANEKGNKSNKK